MIYILSTSSICFYRCCWIFYNTWRTSEHIQCLISWKHEISICLKNSLKIWNWRDIYSLQNVVWLKKWRITDSECCFPNTSILMYPWHSHSSVTINAFLSYHGFWIVFHFLSIEGLCIFHIVWSFIQCKIICIDPR